MNKKIISIQSTVLNNLVGNQAARYILMPRKYEFYEIPTIILTSHKAIKNSLNIPMSKLNPWIIFKNLKNIYNLSKNDLTIVGYLPDKKSTYSIDKILKIQKNILLDPVMGDVGIGLYVPSDVADYFKKIASQAKYLSANFFEWSYLNSQDYKNYQILEVFSDIQSFSKKNKSILLIRSVPFKKKLMNIICSPSKIYFIETPNLNFSQRVHGAGDLTTALFADQISKNYSEKKILENVTNDIYRILHSKKMNDKKVFRFKARNLNSL